MADDFESFDWSKNKKPLTEYMERLQQEVERREKDGTLVSSPPAAPYTFQAKYNSKYRRKKKK